MIGGSILLTEEGLDFKKIDQTQVFSIFSGFCLMVDKAHQEEDRLYYVYSAECNFYKLSFDPNVKCLIGQTALQLLQNTFRNPPSAVSNENDFDNKSNPRIRGGFRYSECPEVDYIYDVPTMDSWHTEWLRSHPEQIQWRLDSNCVFPRPDFVISILSCEVNEASEENGVVNKFHDYVKCLDERQRRARAFEIGEKVCLSNYYTRETELEKLEYDHGNRHAEFIFSIKRDGKFQFLSIDTCHCMFELCDDKGLHLGEFRFDGSPNGQKTASVDHSLKCVAEWKRKTRTR